MNNYSKGVSSSWILDNKSLLQNKENEQFDILKVAASRFKH